MDWSLWIRPFAHEQSDQDLHYYSGIYVCILRANTVKSVKIGHSQNDQKLVFKTNYGLMQVKVLQNAPR